MKIYGYIRVSSKGQVDGDGPERQEDAITKFYKAHGLEFAGFFSDSITGTSEGLSRPAFSEMLSYIDTHHHVGAVVIERIDRLARDLMIGEVMLAELRKRNIQLFCADQGTCIDMASDGGDPTRVLIRQIMGALAQWEKANLVKKLSAAKERIRAKGLRCEGQRPFGKNQTERTIITLLKQFSEVNGMAPSSIARLLNDGGFKTRTGTAWSRQSVEYTMKQLILKGIIQ